MTLPFIAQHALPHSRMSNMPLGLDFVDLYAFPVVACVVLQEGLEEGQPQELMAKDWRSTGPPCHHIRPLVVLALPSSHPTSLQQPRISAAKQPHLFVCTSMPIAPQSRRYASDAVTALPIGIPCMNGSHDRICMPAQMADGDRPPARSPMPASALIHPIARMR